MIKILVYAIAFIFSLQNFILCTPAQAATLNLKSAPSLAAITNPITAKVFKFSNTSNFYEELDKAIRSKGAVRIETPFTSYEEFPGKLQEIFELENPEIDFTYKPQRENFEQHPESSSPPVFANPVRIPMPGLVSSPSYPVVAPALQTPVQASVKIHYKALVSVLAMTTAGAGIGGGFGTMFGGIGAAPLAAIGAVTGLVSWAVVDAMISRCYKVSFEVKPNGTISVVLDPKMCLL